MKPHNLRRLLLLAVLMVGCAVCAVGVTTARYRSQMEDAFYLQVRPRENVRMGVLSTGENEEILFTPSDTMQWTLENGTATMNFAVANGEGPAQYAKTDCTFSLRLIGSLGLWDGTQNAQVTLRLPDKLAETGYREYPAEVTQIRQDSQLYHSYGEGWLFAFRQDGKELEWTLEAGTFSYIPMTLVVEGEKISEETLLQLQIINK